MIRFRTSLSLVTATCLSLAAQNASAAEGSNKKAEAEFRAGLDAMKSGRNADACRRFAEADRLDRKVGYVVNLARCEAKENRLFSARDTWKRALDLATETNDARKSDVERGLQSAQEDIPRVQLSVADSRDVAATLDGTHVDLEKLQAGVDVELGRHVVVLSKAGHKPARVEFEAKRAQERLALSAPALASDAPEASVVASNPASPPAAAKPTPVLMTVPLAPMPSATPWMRYAAVGFMASGVSALGMGGYFALRASAKNQDSLAACPGNVCTDDRAIQKRAEAKESADLATIALIAGGILSASGVTLWVLSPKSSTTVGVQPTWNSASLTITGRY